MQRPTEPIASREQILNKLQFFSLFYTKLMSSFSSFLFIIVLTQPVTIFCAYLFVNSPWLINKSTLCSWVFCIFITFYMPPSVAQRVKRLPETQEIWVQSLGQEDPLEKEVAAYSSTLVWKIPWLEETGRPQSMGSQRVGHD